MLRVMKWSPKRRDLHIVHKVHNDLHDRCFRKRLASNDLGPENLLKATCEKRMGGMHSPQKIK
jgi:hypothetical protein